MNLLIIKAAVIYAWSYGRIIDIQSNLRRKKLHRTNQGSIFLGGSFSNRYNVRVEYLTWNSIRPRFVKNTSMQNPVKSLKYIKSHSLSSPDLLKFLAILSDTTVRRSGVDQKTLKPHWKSEKGHISLGDQQSLFTSFSKTLLTTEKKTNTVEVFSRRPFLKIFHILKYKDHQSGLPTIWKTRLFQTHIEEFN